MKKGKRLITAIVVIALLMTVCFALTACGEGSSNTDPGVTDPGTTDPGDVVKVSITFHGTEDKVVKVNKGSTVTPPTGITDKQGYTFVGWYFDDGTFANALSDTTTFDEDADLYAKYAPKTDTPYKVDHYFEQGAENFVRDGSKTQTLTGTTGSTVTATPITVSGYYYDENNANNVTSGTVAADGSLVLKLYYVGNYYTVEYYFETLSGTYESDSDDNEKFADNSAGGTITVQAKTFEHFTYDEATTTQLGKASGTVAADGTTVFSLYYSRKSYAVTFEDGTTDGTTQNFKYEQIPSYSGTTPTKERSGGKAYAFKGWDKAFAPVTGPETYTAVWFEAKDYTGYYYRDEDQKELPTELGLDATGYTTVQKFNGTAVNGAVTFDADDEDEKFYDWDIEIYAESDTNKENMISKITHKISVLSKAKFATIYDRAGTDQYYHVGQTTSNNLKDDFETIKYYSEKVNVSFDQDNAAYKVNLTASGKQTYSKNYSRLGLSDRLLVGANESNQITGESALRNLDEYSMISFKVKIDGTIAQDADIPTIQIYFGYSSAGNSNQTSVPIANTNYQQKIDFFNGETRVAYTDLEPGTWYTAHAPLTTLPLMRYLNGKSLPESQTPGGTQPPHLIMMSLFDANNKNVSYWFRDIEFVDSAKPLDAGEIWHKTYTSSSGASNIQYDYGDMFDIPNSGSETDTTETPVWKAKLIGGDHTTAMLPFTKNAVYYWNSLADDSENDWTFSFDFMYKDKSGNRKDIGIVAFAKNTENFNASGATFSENLTVIKKSDNSRVEKNNQIQANTWYTITLKVSEYGRLLNENGNSYSADKGETYYYRFGVCLRMTSFTADADGGTYMCFANTKFTPTPNTAA